MNAFRLFVLFCCGCGFLIYINFDGAFGNADQNDEHLAGRIVR